MSAKKTPITLLILFSLPVVVTTMLLLPLTSIMPAIYAENTTATMATIGIVMVLSRIVDAVTDPLMGFLSDRTHSRIGRRKPWILVGGLLAMLSARYLFVPPADADIYYFATWSICAYLAWTMIFIPYNAWTCELSGDYQDRARIFAYRNMFGGIGATLLMLAPLALSPITGSTAIDGPMLDLLAWGIVILAPFLLLVTVIFVPEGKHVSVKENDSFLDALKAVKNNNLFLIFALALFMGGLGIGINVALYFLIMDNYLQLGEHFSVLSAAGMATGVVSMPLWVKIVAKFGKHRPWSVAMMSNIILFPVMLMLEPGPSAFIPFLIISVVLGFIGGAAMIAPPSMLADIADLDILRSGVNRTGSYFSFLTFLSKINMAIGGGLAFFIAGMFGYEAKGANDDFAIFGLILTYAGFPGLISLISGLIIWRYYPLTEHRQSIIRKRIEQNEERAHRKKQKTGESSILLPETESAQ